MTHRSLMRRRFFRENLIVFVFGAGFGIWFLGLRSLLPSFDGWIKNDAVLNQIAFRYFWNSPILQFPLSSTPSLGVDWGTGLHSNGENLPIALLSKPIAQVLGGDFQFQGIWLVVCFALQALIVNQIFQKLGLQLSARVLGTVVVTLSPFLIHRISTMWHLQLAAHWVLLLAFLFYLQNRHARAWFALLGLVLALNVYLFVMVFAIWIASLYSRTRRGSGVSDRYRRFLLELCGGIVVAGSVLAVAGHLTYLGDGSVEGPGFYRASPMTFLNPSEANLFASLRELFSVSGRTWLPEDSEGFAYLGLGVIAVAPLAAIRVVSRKHKLQTDLWPLIFVITSLFLIAVSHRIAIGGMELVIPLPLWLIDLRQVVRSAPRLVWPLAYAITIGVWTVFARWAKTGDQRIRKLVLAAVFVVQILDVMPYVIAQRHEVRRLSEHPNHFVSDRWNLLLRSYDSVSIVPTFDFYLDHSDSTTEVQAWADSDRLLNVVQFCSEHNLKLNFAYVSRPVTAIVERANKEIESELSSGNLKSGTIYLISTEDLWLRSTARTNADAFVLDGFYVVLGPPKTG